MYDSQQALDVRLLDGPGTTSASPAFVTDPIVDAIVVGGSLKTQDQGLAAITAAGKLAVADAALEALILAGALKTNDQGLAAITVGGKLAVADAALEAVIQAGALKVTIVGGNTGAISTNTTAVAAAAAAAAVKATAGRIYSITVTTIGTAQVLLYDNATTSTGTVVGVIPANAPPGDLPIYASKPFSTGLWAATGGGSPAFTVAYS